MKILIVHNKYREYGGEDRVVDSQSALLRERGHEIISFNADSSTIRSLPDKIAAAANYLYSLKSRREIKSLIAEKSPDIIHVHNTFPLISPSIFHQISSLGVPCVATLHNYRILCPTGMLFHNGRIDRRSITGSPFWTVTEKAYSNSAVQSFALASAISAHKVMRIWTTGPDRLLPLTNHAAEMFASAGVPKSRMSVLPNFSSGQTSAPKQTPGLFALFVGRLSPEKGLEFLLNAWRSIDYPLVIVGDGPLNAALRSLAPANVDFVGQKSREQVAELMLQARFLIVPSLWYEMFPMVLLEAFSQSLPVLASSLGSLSEIVEHEKTGVLFEPGDRLSLAEGVTQFLKDDAFTLKLARTAHDTWRSRYSPDAGYSNLMNLYTSVIGRRPA